MSIERKTLLVLTVVSALVLAIMACGGGQTEEPPAPAVEIPAEEPVEEPPAEPAAGGELDWTLEPTFGDLELETGFLPDPYGFEILSGGPVYAGDAVPGCNGYAMPNPDLNFYWTGNDGFLRIFFVPFVEGRDTTLIINDATANWHCNDDTYGVNPSIDFEQAPSGWYSIWVGSFSPDELISGDLYFTEMDITPDDIGAETGAAVPAGEEISQWAISATASTEWGTDDYSAMQATGAPNTSDCGDYSTAWATASSDAVAWLRLEYATPVIPTEINIHESYNPDAVSMVEVVDLDGEAHTVYQAEPTIQDVCPGVLTITLSDAPGAVNAVIVHLDQSDHSGWNEIDAVELVGVAQ